MCAAHRAHMIPHQAGSPGVGTQPGNYSSVPDAVFIMRCPSPTTTNTTGELVIGNNTNFADSLTHRARQKTKPESTKKNTLKNHEFANSHNLLFCEGCLTLVATIRS